MDHVDVDERTCPLCREASENPHAFQPAESDPDNEGCAFEMPSGYLCGAERVAPEHVEG